MNTQPQYQLVLLPTKEASELGFINEFNESAKIGLATEFGFDEFNGKNNFQHRPLYLYIIDTKAEIKFGDKVISSRYGKPMTFGNFENSYLNECKKVIASTDKSLNLPTISDSDVKWIANEYNRISKLPEIDLETEWYNPKYKTADKYLPAITKLNDLDGCFVRLKTNPDGSVVIVKPVEEESRLLITKLGVDNSVKPSITIEQKVDVEKLAERAWGKDQSTNPMAVNPHAFTYGYKIGYNQALKDNAKQYSREEVIDIICKYEKDKTLESTFAIDNWINNNLPK